MEINNLRHPAGQLYWRLTRYFTMCENVHSLSERYDFSIKRRKENIRKTESLEHNVISLFGHQVLFASLSVGEGMSWNKIWRSKGFVFTPMTLSLKRKKSFGTANRIAKSIYFIENWRSIRGLKQTKQQNRTKYLESCTHRSRSFLRGWSTEKKKN